MFCFELSVGNKSTPPKEKKGSNDKQNKTKKWGLQLQTAWQPATIATVDTADMWRWVDWAVTTLIGLM